MKFSLATLGALLLAAQPALSTVVITNPVAATSVKGGKRLTVEWNDDGKAPKLSDWGGVNIWLAAGSQDVQYKLQRIATNVAVTKTSQRFKVDDSIGPAGQYYFIRMEGTKAGANGIPPMSFSARFRLTDMDGKFNSTVLAAAQGKEGSSASGASSPQPAAGGAGGAAGSPARPSASTSTIPRLVSPTSGTSAFARPASTGTPSSAGFVDVPKAAAMLGAIAAGALALF